MAVINDVIFYVSPEGNDAWTGSSPLPGNDGRIGPFATLGKAVEASRDLSKGFGKKIVLRGGSYYETYVELKSSDSGLRIEAMEGETPILYGGAKITGWKREESGPLWYAELPGVSDAGWDFRLMVVNGKLCKRSRLPEKGTFQHLTVFEPEWTSTGMGGWARKPTLEELTTVRYKPGDLGPWLNIKNAELTVYHRWDESLAGIESHDAENRILRLSNPCGHPPGSFEHYNYVVWNTREGMSGPGQWYHDRLAGRLVYWPEAGEDMNAAEVIIPTTDVILNFIEKVSNITLKGLVLSVTKTPLMAPDFGAMRMPGAVQGFAGMDDCVFDGLVIRHTGGHGIKLTGICRSVSIENCEISQTGAGGIFFQNNMQETEKKGVNIMVSCLPQDEIEDQPNCRIFNNYIHNVGVIHTSAIAIMAHCCSIMHNEISDTPYSGICYGPPAGVRYGGSKARIENNLISRVMQFLNDGGAIYATFTNDGIIRGNIVCDIQQDAGPYAGRNGLYLDENTQGWIMEENLVINCSHPTLNHMARENTIRNNVFVCDTFLKVNILRCKDYTFEHNVIFSKDKVIFAGNPDAIAGFGKNLIYSLKGEYEEYHIDEKYKHYDTVPLRFRDGTIAADPLFVDPLSDNFALKAGSPAFGLGIGNIDVSKAGRLK